MFLHYVVQLKKAGKIQDKEGCNMICIQDKRFSGYYFNPFELSCKLFKLTYRIIMIIMTYFE